MTNADDRADLQTLLESLRPTTDSAVYRMVEAAGVDMAPWSVNREGDAIRPSDNMHRNSQWGFGGGTDPIVLCIWWKDLSVGPGFIEHRGNMKSFRTMLANARAQPKRTSGEAQRLTGKIRKSEAVERLIYEAYSKVKPSKLILLDGKVTEREAAATESSEPDARILDNAEWYVHEYDPYSGDFRLVRGVLPPPSVKDELPDPAADPEFQRILEDGALTDTEKDALVKLRVGQGWFRVQLIKRWGGCAVTGCSNERLLVASHIVPWSKCLTKSDRLNPANGLLLTPTLDKLFDFGLVTFDDRFRTLFSSRLSPVTISQLRLDGMPGLRKKEFNDIQPFLQRHRSEIFQGPPR